MTWTDDEEQKSSDGPASMTVRSLRLFIRRKKAEGNGITAVKGAKVVISIFYKLVSLFPSHLLSHEACLFLL